MYVTIRDVTNIEKLKSLKLVAGGGGLGNRVEKVGILDFEFTKNGASQCVDAHWMPHDFVITTFLYAKDNEALLVDAVKKLNACGVSGIAVKNVFALDIPREIIRYANSNNLPFFIFEDNSLFFEDIIISVNNLIVSFSDNNLAEQKINAIIHGDFDKNHIKNMAKEINYAFMNSFFCAYFLYRDPENLRHLPFLISAEARRAREVSGASIIKYKDGFFYIASATNAKKITPDESVDSLCQTLGLQPEHYHVGVSDQQYYLNNFKKALLQSLYAAEYGKLADEKRCAFRDLGIYQFLLPHADDEWLEDFYMATISPLVEHDLNNHGNLLDFAMTYEMCYGNNKEIALRYDIHENTIRYRLGKIKNILGFSGDNASFEQQLLLTMKIHRIKKTSALRVPGRF